MERGKVYRARERSSVGVSGVVREQLVREGVVGGDVVVGECGGKGEPAPRQVEGG